MQQHLTILLNAKKTCPLVLERNWKEKHALKTMPNIQRVFQTRVAMVVLILSLTVNQITLTAGWFISQHLLPPAPHLLVLGSQPSFSPGGLNAQHGDFAGFGKSGALS